MKNFSNLAEQISEARNRLRLAVTLTLLAVVALTSARAQEAGALDVGFDSGKGANGPVGAVLAQPNGKIIVSGSFSAVNGVTCSGIARLNINGSVDTSFVLGKELSGVKVLALQSDGKILVSGTGTNPDGRTQHTVFRLNKDGSVDPTFSSNSDANIFALVVQPDGKIVVGGIFTAFSGTSHNTVVRLNKDGSLDESFDVSASLGRSKSGQCFALALQTDGKILMGGAFGSVNGINRSRVARLNNDGSLDLAFDAGPSSLDNESLEEIFTLAVQPDGKIIVGGQFFQFGGVARRNVARLNVDGSLDQSFQASVTENVHAVGLQPDGKILFTAIPKGIVRYDSSGSLDPSFNSALSVDEDDDGVFVFAVQQDGKIVVVGEEHEFGSGQSNVLRLNNDTPVIAPVGTPAITESVDKAKISRSAGQVATIMFTRTDENLSAKVKLTYSLTGSAINGADYATLSGKAKFQPGQRAATIQIRPLAGGANGSVVCTLQPGNGYNLSDSTSLKIKLKK